MAAGRTTQSQASKVVAALRKSYPDAKCSLDFSNPLELLVATILSAQCTDERVNLVTKDLFKKYRSAADFASASIKQLESDVQSTGFYRNKAKNIQACCRILVEQYGGELPDDLDSLVELPGVGRKTANVVLGTAFGIASGIVVDTHVARLSLRLGLTKQKNPVKIEQELNSQISKRSWIAFGHRMIQHGRRICIARKPKCDECPMVSFCPRVGVAGKSAS